MKCAFHPAVEAGEFCTVCGKALCGECAHKIKNKTYCQECLVEGADWAATMKNLRLPADAPKKAAWLSLIPGMGAVYNNEYMKALTYFAVWAGLSVMGDKIHGIFGFGAVVFIVFTMFDSYRTAQAKTRDRIQAGPAYASSSWKDQSGIGWGIALIVIGILFLLQNIIPYHYLNRLWPLLFILLGGYLIYRALQERKDRSPNASGPPPAISNTSSGKEDI